MKPAGTAAAPLHFIIPEERPPARRHVREWRQSANEIAALYADATCRIWHGEELRDQIRRGFSAEVVAAFDDLPPHAGGAALASWCLLHLFGGLFHAPGLRSLAPMKVPDDQGVAAFNDVHSPSSGWTSVDTALLWSRPDRPEWAFAIDMKIRAWRQTPPRLPPDHVLLGHALALAAVKRGARSEDDQWIGQVRSIPGIAGADSLAFVAPDGTIVALRETSTL